MRVAYRLKQLILLSGDILSYVIGFWMTLLLRHLAIPSEFTLLQHAGLFAGVFFLWILVNFMNGLYDLDRSENQPLFYRRFGETTLISSIISVIFFYILPYGRITPKTILVLAIILGYGLSLFWRLLFNRLLKDRALRMNVLFVGYAQEFDELAGLLQSSSHKGYRLAAWIDPTGTVNKQQNHEVSIYQSLQTVRPAVTNHHIDAVVIAPHLRQDQEALRELYELLFWDVQVTDMISFYELITGRIPPSIFSEAWFIDHLRQHDTPIYDRVRGILDYLGGSVLCLVFLVLLPFIAAAIRLESRGPIFIKQKRVGRFGKEFVLYKFRSMYALSDDGSAEIGGVQFAVKGDTRVTRVGRFLRNMRIDELPQCINLLKRDITLIGPRPERFEIVKMLRDKMPYYPLRHIVRPGLTSWALLHQNYTDTLESSLQKLQYDLYYIKNRSFLLDLSILLRTVNVVIRMMGQ